MKKNKLYSVSEAASMLPVKISNQYLYFYLKKLKIVDADRIPSKEYLDKGLLDLVYGSKCSYSSKFPITKFTEKGIDWLLNELYPEIQQLEAIGFFDDDVNKAA